MAVFQKEPKARSCVTCPTCSCEIPLVCELRLPTEFSVPCPGCGRRTVYQSAETHDPDDDAGATQTCHAIEFSTKKKESMQPKSWLNEWASSLLQ
jgi:hypothetical protein